VIEGTSRSDFNLNELAGRIVAAYVSNNPVPVSDLPNFIRLVHGTIAGLSSGGVAAVTVLAGIGERPTQGQIRKSIRDDGIVSFVDGRTYKTLKRHLSSHGLDPRGYRERYGLPADYPMVAPGYAAQRSALAKAIGLGQPGAQVGRERKGRMPA